MEKESEEGRIMESEISEWRQNSASCVLRAGSSEGKAGTRPVIQTAAKIAVNLLFCAGTIFL